MRRCRVNLRTITILVILQGTAVVLFCGWYMEFRSSSLTPPNNKVHVLLLSSWRSGSTFMGQVFSQHPSVFYLMEPARHVWTRLYKRQKLELQTAVRDLLQSLFKCDFSLMEAYLPEHHNVSTLFRWFDSRALCSPPACSLTPRGQFSNLTQCWEKCGAGGLQQAQDTCSTYSHVVLKVVRVLELESFYPLLQDPNLDLRIIHLVRDPRAVLRSREAAMKDLLRDNSIVLEYKNTPEAELQYQVMQEICSSHVRINERAVMEPPPFLEGRYKMVRYEDVVRNPLEEINNIYEFVGLKMTTELEEWIYHLTHGTGNREDKYIATPRNATHVSQAWRSMLSHDKVKQIQEVCKGAMSLLGYRTVDDEKEQNNLEIDLLVPREPDQPVVPEHLETRYNMKNKALLI